MSQAENNNKSEVARIKQQIEAEYSAACQALHGPAIVAQHQIITAHMENMGRHGETLADLVGNEEAAKFLVQTMQASADAEQRAKKGKEGPKDGKR